jgi:digeranylgeranylglycerophospholipid reductase
MYDAIVVGSGLIGSYIAYKLAEKGHKILVLERRQRAGESACCTGIISQECVNAFSIEDRVILRQVKSASLFSPSGNHLHIQRTEPQACILDRVSFEIAMAERAQRAGAEYAFNSRVKDISIKSHGASIMVSGQGKGLEIQTRTVVIASGFAPGLRVRLGLGRFVDFTVGAQAEVATSGADEVEVYFGDMAPGFFAWLVPTTPSMARVGLLSRKKPGLYLRNWLAYLASQGKIAAAQAELCYGGIPLKPLPRTYGESLLVVGDAAGQVKPTSGGGIYYGLLSADIAAETLHQALEDGDLSAKRLAGYERGWKKRLGRELRVGYWARKLFEHLSNRQIDRVFEIVKAGGIDEALLKDEDLSFDWHSKTILRLLGYQIVARAMDVIKLPFRTGRIDR